MKLLSSLGLCFLISMSSLPLEAFQPAPSYSVVRLTEDDEIEQSPDWSPDGDRIAFTSDAGLSILDLSERTKTVLHPTGEHPDWSSDGTRIAFVLKDAPPYDIWVIPGSGGAPAPMFIDADFWNMRWAPDESRVATSGWVGHVTTGFRLYAPGTTKPQLLAHGWVVEPGPFDWTPDGRSLIFSSNRDLMIASVADDTATVVTSLPFEPRSPRCSPDGSTILYSTHEGIWMAPITGGPANRVWTMPVQWFGGMLRVAWAPDGRRFVFNSNHEGSVDLYLLDLDSPVPVRSTTWGRLKRSFE